MNQMNMNLVAVLVAAHEGKVQEMSIAQIKEVLKCLQTVCLANTEASVEVAHYLGLK